MTDEDRIRAEMWAYATVYRILRYALIVLDTAVIATDTAALEPPS